MDALCRKKAWVFEPICEDNYDILREAIYLNIELAIKVGLLLSGYTLEEFDNNPTLVASFGIVLDEVTLHEQDNNLVFIEILENFLKILNETNIDF